MERYNQFNERYSRQIILDQIGTIGQNKLLDAKVLIVGMGGLGSPISLYLTGAGVGTIGIIDSDKVTTNNLHRQILYTELEVGLSKVEQAKTQLNLRNSDVRIIAYNEYLTIANVEKIFADYDIIIDGVDNFTTRYVIDAECKKQNKPYVYGAIKEFIGQVSVFNYKGGVSYSDVFTNSKDDEKVYGLFGTIPGIIGILETNEVIKIITGMGEVLSNKLLQYDLLTNTQEIFDLV